MRGNDREFVGIELRLDELRAVYVRNRGNLAEVAAVGHVAMPEGGLADGVVSRPKVVAEALKTLLASMRVPAGAGAVIGIQSDEIVVRTLSVPPAPKDELETIVAGEVEHYHMLRSHGTHAFVELSPIPTRDGASPRSLVVAAAEEQVTKSVDALVIESHLRLVALEPVEFGILRFAAATMRKDETAFVVTVGPKSTDLAAFSRGHLCFYRRIECGVNHFLPPPPALTLADEGRKPAAPKSPSFNMAALASLCTEIGRSIDYLDREFGEGAQFAKLHLCVGDGAVAELAAHISEQTAFPVEVISPSAGAATAEGVGGLIDGREGLRYSAAFGLAMREYVALAGPLPQIDLFTADRARAERRLIQRHLTGSLAASLATIAIGLAARSLYSHQASGLEAQATLAAAHAKSVQAEGATVVERHRKRLRRIRLLSVNGVPAQPLMDAIATSIDPGVGIQTLTISPDRTVMITADATTEDRMLRTVKRMQRIPILRNVMVQTFSNKGPTSEGLTFTVAAKTLPVSQVRLVNSFDSNSLADLPGPAVALRSHPRNADPVFGEAGK